MSAVNLILRKRVDVVFQPRRLLLGEVFIVAPYWPVLAPGLSFQMLANGKQSVRCRKGRDRFSLASASNFSRY
ncbi:MAG: hypothetical protein DMD72_10160 [Gemmatimonadetes bacterium]|nr:MAG: hypothetical protein DMD72_10160 [Gemmatimonadota bacterium]